MFGQMPGGMQATPMPMPGMPGPMPMPPMPIPSVATKSPQLSPANKTETPPGPPTTVNGPMNDSCQNMEAPSNQHQHHQIHVPRACWTYVEEEFLVNIYSEFTFGKKMRKMTKQTWELIADRLCQDSRKKLPQVTKKTWMQCKDKWNNMMKKHKYRRAEYLAKLNSGSGDYRAIEREDIFEALERILNFENTCESQVNFSNSFEQIEDGIEDDCERVTMVGNSVVNNIESNNVCKYTKESAMYSSDIATPNRDQISQEQSIEAARAAHYEDERTVRSEGENEIEHVQINGNTNIVASDQIPNSPERNLKRSNDRNDDGDDANKRARVEDVDSHHHHHNDNLYNLLLRQTELLEQSRQQHNELLEQVRVSEENTRLLMLQAIKDLKTILERMIKTE